MKRTNIILICPYPIDTVPGQRLKYEQYLSYLSEKGFDVRVLPFFSEQTYSILYRKGHFSKKILGVFHGIFRRLLQIPSITKADGIYIFLNVCPIGPKLLEQIFINLAKRVIYDIDDMVHQLETSPQNRIARFLRSRERFFYLLRRADHVITCTPELDRIARIYNKSTTDISSTIDTKRYVPINLYRNDKTIVLGWSGSHSTIKYLHLLDNVLQRLSKHYKFKLLVMGTNDFDIEGVDVEAVDWSTQIEMQTLQRMDIGLYPLPDDEWIKGKSGLKAIQYMGLALPVVASDVGCNNRVIEHNRSGMLVMTDDEWYSALSKLIVDQTMRRRLGTAARQRVETLYSIDANKEKYLRIFEQIYRNPHSAT